MVETLDDLIDIEKVPKKRLKTGLKVAASVGVVAAIGGTYLYLKASDPEYQIPTGAAYTFAGFTAGLLTMTVVNLYQWVLKTLNRY